MYSDQNKKFSLHKLNETCTFSNKVFIITVMDTPDIIWNRVPDGSRSKKMSDRQVLP